MTSSAYHDGHLDEANRVRALQRHENEVRRIERERHARRLGALCPPHLVVDPTGFGEGCVIDLAPYPAPIGEAA